MAETVPVKIRVADLPQVKQALADAAETIAALRSQLQAWEPRVRCPQCGQRYSAPACGPAHVIAWFRVNGPEEESLPVIGYEVAGKLYHPDDVLIVRPAP